MESSYRCEEGAETSTGASYEIFTEQKIQATLLDWETVRRLILKDEGTSEVCCARTILTT